MSDEHAGHGCNQAGPCAKAGPVLTVRAVSGLSGDMILAGLCRMNALHPQGLKEEELDELCAHLRMGVLQKSVRLHERSVGGINGWSCRVDLPHEHAHRSLADILHIIEQSSMGAEAAQLAAAAFNILAQAEGAVHGVEPSKITFHEVGALDSIVDICLACMLFERLHPARFICSPLPLADGVIECAHGRLPSPAPAVLAMLPGVTVSGFGAYGETVTPTALALLKALGAEFGPWPSMRVRGTALVYGSRVFADVANGAIWAIGDII